MELLFILSIPEFIDDISIKEKLYTVFGAIL